MTRQITVRVYTRLERTSDAVRVGEAINKQMSQRFAAGHDGVPVTRLLLAEAYIRAGEKAKALAVLQQVEPWLPKRAARLVNGMNLDTLARDLRDQLKD